MTELKMKTLHSMQLTVNNLETVASWCSGNIKGTRLPREQRMIQFWCNGEHDVYINDWIVRMGQYDGGRYIYRVFDDHDYRALFLGNYIFDSLGGR